MKSVAALVAGLAAAVVVSAALAGTPTTSGSGSGSKPPKGCKTVGVSLKGTVAAAPGANPTLPFGLKVTVTSANKYGSAYASATQPVTVTVTSGTTISLKGSTSATLSSLLANDSVTVKAKPCTSDLANGATPTLTATSVDAKPAKQPKTHGKNS